MYDVSRMPRESMSRVVGAIADRRLVCAPRLDLRLTLGLGSLLPRLLRPLLEVRLLSSHLVSIAVRAVSQEAAPVSLGEIRRSCGRHNWLRLR